MFHGLETLSMAFSISSSLSNLASSRPNFLVPSSSSSFSSISQQNSNIKSQFRCEFEQYSEQKDAKKPAGKDQNRSSSSSSKLGVGSPIIITAAPKMIKTAASMPCLRVNAGLVKPGDVGRILSRKPMDVWAVRLSIGTYLIDGKYFKALEIDE